MTVIGNLRVKRHGNAHRQRVHCHIGAGIIHAPIISGHCQDVSASVAYGNIREHRVLLNAAVVIGACPGVAGHAAGPAGQRDVATFAGRPVVRCYGLRPGVYRHIGAGIIRAPILSGHCQGVSAGIAYGNIREHRALLNAAVVIGACPGVAGHAAGPAGQRDVPTFASRPIVGCRGLWQRVHRHLYLTVACASLGIRYRYSICPTGTNYYALRGLLCRP